MFPYRSTLLSLGFTLALVGAMGGYESALAQDAGTPTVSDRSAAGELAFWNQIKNSQNPEDFRSYLLNFPNGMFVDPALREFEQAGGQKSDLPGAVFAKETPDADGAVTAEEPAAPIITKAKVKKAVKVNTKETAKVSQSKKKSKRIVRIKSKVKAKKVASAKPRKVRSGVGLAQPASLKCQSGRIVNGRCVAATGKKRGVPVDNRGGDGGGGGSGGSGGGSGGGWGG